MYLYSAPVAPLFVCRWGRCASRKRLREAELRADGKKRLYIDRDSGTDEQCSTMFRGVQETKGGGGGKARGGEELGEEGPEEGEHLFCLGQMHDTLQEREAANGLPTFKHAHFYSQFDCDNLQVIFSNCFIACIPCAQCHVLNHCSTVCR